MGVMLDMELALEAKARQEGEARGKASGIVLTCLEDRRPRTIILKRLEKHLGDADKARMAFDEYVAEHPEEAAYLESPEKDTTEK